MLREKSKVVRTVAALFWLGRFPEVDQVISNTISRPLHLCYYNRPGRRMFQSWGFVEDNNHHHRNWAFSLCWIWCILNFPTYVNHDWNLVNTYRLSFDTKLFLKASQISWEIGDSGEFVMTTSNVFFRTVGKSISCVKFKTGKFWAIFSSYLSGLLRESHSMFGRLTSLIK